MGGDRAIETTDDRLLGGRVRLRQPAEGYRAAIDPVLLAASVPVRPGERVLDLGAGAGAATLALHARVPGARITGLERDPAMVTLLAENIAANGAGDAVEVQCRDLLDLPGKYEDAFDHAMANPPFLDAGHAEPSPVPGRQSANVEGAARLEDWVRAALFAVRRKGTISLVHRADRLDDLIAALHGRAGELWICPLWPRVGAPAKRVVVRARKGVRSPATLSPGLVLHELGGDFTATAEAVLRDAAPLSP